MGFFVVFSTHAAPLAAVITVTPHWWPANEDPNEPGVDSDHLAGQPRPSTNSAEA